MECAPPCDDRLAGAENCVDDAACKTDLKCAGTDRTNRRGGGHRLRSGQRDDHDEYGQGNSIDREGPVRVGSHVSEQPDDCDQTEDGGGREPPSKLWREARMEKFTRFE